jgi:hypothetical protein
MLGGVGLALEKTKPWLKVRLGMVGIALELN